MRLERTKFLVDSPMKYVLFRQQISSPSTEPVHAFPTRQPDNLYVVSTFGLSAALLRPTIVFELFLLFQVTTTKAFFTSIIK